MAYKIAANWNVAAGSLTTVKGTVTRNDPIAERVKLGSVKRSLLNGSAVFNGRSEIKWHWDGISRVDVDSLLGYLGSDKTVGSAKVTILTPNFQDVFARYNAYMINPQPQDDWQRIPAGGGFVVDFNVTFVLIEAL